jgi:hypothetical protein
MSAGSPRGAKVNGVPYVVTGDADISLNPRITKESIPHSGGNMQKRTIESGHAEAVKFTLTPSEYDVLRAQAEASGDIPLSYEMADGSSFKTVGEVNLGPYSTQDSFAEVEFLTSTGVWDIFAAS